MAAARRGGGGGVTSETSAGKERVRFVDCVIDRFDARRLTSAAGLYGSALARKAPTTAGASAMRSEAAVRSARR